MKILLLIIEQFGGHTAPLTLAPIYRYIECYKVWAAPCPYSTFGGLVSQNLLLYY